MLYVIQACDQLYNGWHGLENWSIWDCENEDEAISIARENSMELITSYSNIYEQLENDIENWIDENMSEDDIDQLRFDIYQDDIDYNIWKIKPNIEKDFNINILEKMLNDDPEDFIETYCYQETV